MKVFYLSMIAVLMLAPTALAETFITSDGTGTYVGGLAVFNPNGAYVSNTPAITVDGYYVDGTPKKKYRQKKWTKLREHSFKLSSSLKTHSK